MQFADINDLTVIANEIKDRANKVSGATNGNFAALDSNGDLTDSGHKHSDYLTQHQDISGKADLDENGKLVSSQKPSYTKSEVGLGNVDNTSDATKKTNFTGSIASEDTGFVTGGDAYTELAKKVDKVDGKGLSSNDYTTDEKTKLSGIAANAEVNQNAFSNVKVGSTTIASGEKTATLELEAGSNITLTPDTANKKVVLAATDTTYSDATTSVHGLMSVADKTKLDGVATSATKTESSTTNGNIKINGTETQVYDDSEIKGELSTDTTTIEGNPLNFAILSAQTAKSTILSLEPIQDLHGFDKPWAGGAGKNLLPLVLDDIKTLNTQEWGITWTGNSCVLGNVTFTILTDSEDNVIGIKTNGIASERITFYLKRDLTYQDFPNQMKLNGNTNYSEATFIRIQLKDNPWTADADDLGSSADGVTFQFANNEAIHQAIIRIDSGVSVTNKIFYPMVRLASIADSSFEPYTNICPISGRSEIGILGCGKNLFDKSELVLKPWNGTTTNNQRARLEHATHLPIGTTVTIKVSDSFLTTYLYARYSMPTDYPGTEIIGDIGWINIKSNTYTTEAPYFGLVFKRIDNGNITLSDLQAMDIQLEINNAPTDYSPYTKSNDLTISLGQTVYGGTLDVENGVLVVDKKYKLYDGSSDEEWTYSSGWSKTNTNVFYSNVVVTDAYYPSEEFISITNCNCFEGVSRKSLYEADTNGVAFSGNRPTANFTVRISKSTASSLEDFKTWIASNNIEIVYILNTPITINLTPHTINLLKGVNNISTDGDKITLTYRDGSVATLGDLTSAVDSLDSKIDESKILTDTATGDKYILVVTNGVLDIQQISN